MNPTNSAAFDNLALLYQRLLTTIVRVRAGAQAIDDYPSFLRQTRDYLTAVERQAVQSGYTPADVQNTNYAVVAFLDESILTSNDSRRHQWMPLQAEMYGEAAAGESFFNNLDLLRKRRDSARLPDILEVYYLCLLLGYKGRYADYARDQAVELVRYQNELKSRIEAVRGSQIELWPGEAPGLPDKPVGPTLEDVTQHRFKAWALASIAAVPMLWLLCRTALYFKASGVQASLVP